MVWALAQKAPWVFLMIHCLTAQDVFAKKINTTIPYKIQAQGLGEITGHFLELKSHKSSYFANTDLQTFFVTTISGINLQLVYHNNKLNCSVSQLTNNLSPELCSVHWITQIAEQWENDLSDIMSKDVCLHHVLRYIWYTDYTHFTHALSASTQKKLSWEYFLRSLSTRV